MKRGTASAATVAAAVALAIALGGCGKRTKTETEWGIYQEPVAPAKLPQPTGPDEVRFVWDERLDGGGELGYAIFQPAYSDDGIYVASREGEVQKLNIADGAVIWRRELDTAIFSGVGVGDGLAVVTLDDGTVLALRGDDGEVAWRTPIERQFSAIPAVGRGRVVVRTAAGEVHGLNARNGEAVWSYAREAPGLSVHGDSTPTVAGEAVLVGLANGRVVASDVRSGREFWETEVSFASGRNELERLNDSDASPLVDGEVVYVAAYQGQIAALRLRSAEVIWKADVSTRLPMALGDGRLVVTNELGEVVALNAKTGKVMWRHPGFRGHGMSRPQVVGERVLLGDARGNLHMLNLRDATLLQSLPAVRGAVVALVAGPDSDDGRRQLAVFSARGDLRTFVLASTPP